MNNQLFAIDQAINLIDFQLIPIHEIRILKKK